jgi:hypothetical protein
VKAGTVRTRNLTIILTHQIRAERVRESASGIDRQNHAPEGRKTIDSLDHWSAVRIDRPVTGHPEVLGHGVLRSCPLGQSIRGQRCPPGTDRAEAMRVRFATSPRPTGSRHRSRSTQGDRLARGRGRGTTYRRSPPVTRIVAARERNGAPGFPLVSNRQRRCSTYMAGEKVSLGAWGPWASHGKLDGWQLVGPVEEARLRAFSLSGRRDSNPRPPPWQRRSDRPRSFASVHLIGREPGSRDTVICEPQRTIAD